MVQNKTLPFSLGKIDKDKTSQAPLKGKHFECCVNKRAHVGRQCRLRQHWDCSESYVFHIRPSLQAWQNATIFPSSLPTTDTKYSVMWVKALCQEAMCSFPLPWGVVLQSCSSLEAQLIPFPACCRSIQKSLQDTQSKTLSIWRIIMSGSGKYSGFNMVKKETSFF